MSKDGEAIHDEATSISFGVYSAAEIRKISDCQITNPMSFNQLGHPVPSGLYDLKMGPFSDRGDLMCLTCGLHCEHCPGHYGHIELPLPVCNPMFYKTLLSLLKMTCMTCHRFRIEDHLKKLYLVQQKLLDKGLIIAAQSASEVVLSTSGNDNIFDEDEKSSRKAIKQAVDVALVMKKLDRFLAEEVTDDDDDYVENEDPVKNTRITESLRKGYNKEFLSHNTKSSCCSNCGAVTKTIVFYKPKSRFIYEGFKLNTEDDDSQGPRVDSKKKRKLGDREKTELNPEELKQHLRELWAWDPEIMSNLFPMLKKPCDFPTDRFFVDVLLVPPPKTRPCQYTGGMMTIHPQSSGLQNVVDTVNILKQLLQVIQGVKVEMLPAEAQTMLKDLKGDTPLHKMDTLWKELQQHVDHVVDRDMNSSPSDKGNAWGFKQLIERKQGMFRMNMMGKRVNFAARTVITPDPNIDIDEIGLPEVFAKRLTYREAVTPLNVEELRQAVMNGPDVHPGAMFVESESGHKTMISSHSVTQREALAKTLLTPGASIDQVDGGTKFVLRHLKNNDAMLLNRQPTLHKPSIMSHRARVLKGNKVMRLHYAICKSYNADFDGDEMNAHFPQNEVARSEAYNIVNVCKQYLVPKDGTPLQGLIQDHIIAGVKMTIRGRFFNRDQYQQFVYGALVNLPDAIKLLPPAIIKPEALWSGKQIVSTIVLNLVPEGKSPPTLHTNAKIKANEWEMERPRRWRAGGSSLAQKKEQGPTMTESEVVFRQGEFLTGILDKNQYGATQYSLVHSFFELYGGTYSGKLLSAFSKIFTNFLHTEGFTLGVRDIVVTEGGNKVRKRIMAETKTLGDESAADGVGLTDFEFSKKELTDALEVAHRESRTIPKRRIDIDRAYKERLSAATNKINSACMPKGLVATFPHNNLQLMVQAGAKGSTVNTMQISCLLGQIELEGKRPPLMISGKPLPSFSPYDTRPRAGGFIDGRFMTGIKPQEFFYHCMAGREGLIDTAVKTSRSGYLQRCLVKLLEGLVVNYDQTVRDSCDGSVIQFQYGEDGLDVCKSQYLKSEQLDFLLANKDTIYNEKAIQMAKNHAVDPDGLLKLKRAVKRKKKKKEGGVRNSGFLRYCKKQSNGVVEEVDRNTGRPHSAKKWEMEWRRMDKQDKRKYEKKAEHCPDPVTTTYRADSNFGSVTEAIDDMIDNYIDDKAKSVQGFGADQFKDMLHMKCMHAIVDPGEPVGVLAAQSVGEPSTQMTLNTFHFAGRGDMNVTLGIPRLREILMVASANIKTPSMTIPFLPHVTEKAKENLRVSLNRVTLANVLECVHVNEKIELKGRRRRLVTMRFEFLPKKAYKNQLAVNPKLILDYVEKTFIAKKFMVVLSAVMKEKRINIEKMDKKSRSNAADNEDDDNDNNNDPDRMMEQQERRGFGEGHASSDEEELADDADATEARKKTRQMDGQDFAEEMSDEEVEMFKDLNHQLGDDDDVDMVDEGSNDSWNTKTATPTPTPSTYDGDDGFEDMEEEKTISQEDLEKSNMEMPEAQKRRLYVLQILQSKSGSATVVDYSYDVEKDLWCQLTLSFSVSQKNVDMSNIIRKAAEKAVIREVKNISRAFLIKNDKSEIVLTTEGANIEAMFAHEHVLDLTKLHCNNVHDMARYYGIEAATKTIVYEIVNVFKAYGIVVNPRHLSLIADYMTFDGTYKPFNRIGIENNPSPFQQMTFETAIGFLRAATLAGKRDALDSPSACVVVGKPFSGGTGIFQVAQNLMEIKELNV